MSVNDIGEASGYSKFLNIFNENKDTPWNEWLTLKKIFGKPGKQGVVGILETIDGKSQCVFKISKDIDYLADHENQVMKGLNYLSPFCHNFSKPYGVVSFNRNTEIGGNKNPFTTNNLKYMVPDKMLLQEFVSNSSKLSSYIKSKKIKEDVLFSTIKQVLMFITIAQKYKKFSHYDLHSDNIMMKKCNKNIVFLYVIDEGNQFCVPSYGHYPVVIDFGFSYIEDMDDGPLWPTMSHTSAGFLSCKYDRIVDPKLFLLTISDEIKEFRKSNESKKLRKVVKNIFENLSADDETGWDEITETDASDTIRDIIEEYSEKSYIFDRYTDLCIDIIQTLIILPIEKQTRSKVKQVYKIFISEWVKIENQITNPVYNMYILRTIVDQARHVRSAYLEERTTKEAVNEFKINVTNAVDEVSKFCIFEKINFEKMLCALYVLATNIEDLYYTSIKDLDKYKQKEYKKLKFDTPEKMYAVIDSNIKSNYEYDANTIVYVMDSLRRHTKIFKLKPEEAKNINSTHSFCKGTVMYDIYTANHI